VIPTEEGVDVAGTGDYLLGLVGLAAVVISMAIAGRTLRRALLVEWTGAPALLATGVLSVGMLVAVSELLGLFGLLDGPLLVAACVIVGGGALRLEPMLMRSAIAQPRAAKGRRKSAPENGLRDAPPVSRWELGAAVALAALVMIQWAGPTLLALDRGMYGGDTLWYHMPFAAHFAESGSVTELLYVDPLYLNYLYPQNSELLHGDALLLFGNDFLSPLLNLGWLGLALLAGWCIGRAYGAGAPTTAAVAALMSADLLYSRQPGNANNDVVVIALLLAAVALLVNSRVPTAPGTLITAGLAAGLALGTKLTVVPLIGALTIGVIVIAAAGERLRAAWAWGAGLLAGGGLWYARDLIVSGSPFPFVDLGPLTKPEELQGRDPYAIVHYITDTDVWGRFFRPGLEERLGELWPLTLLLAVAGVVLWLWRDGRIERMLAAVALVAAIAYLLTPLGAAGPEGSPVGFRLNIRYLAPGLALALVLAAIPNPLLKGRERWWRIGALVLFAVLITVSAGAIEAIDTDRIPGSLLLAVAVLGPPLAIVVLSRRGIDRVPLAAGAAVALVALAIVGRTAQEDYFELRYSSAAPEYPRDGHPSAELEQGLGAAYDWARGVQDASIGLSGTTGALFQYGLWGPDSSNRVRYIGERGNRGAFREIAECPEWIAAVNGGDYEFVVTTPAYDQDNPESATAPVESLWIQGARNIRKLAGTGLVDLWEVAGPLDPAACADAPPRDTATPGAPAD
jgi:hypothetical protein